MKGLFFLAVNIFSQRRSVEGMDVTISELMMLQAKSVAVMFCAGISVELLWQLKKYAKGRISNRHTKNHKCAGSCAQRVLIEIGFWAISAVVISRFMYYGSFGRLTLYSVAGFFVGLILWKKLCCVIIK